MPMYDTLCPACGDRETVFRKVADRDSDLSCGTCGAATSRILSAPMVVNEIPTYISPVTGQPIHSRAQRREDLKKHGYLEWEPGMKKDIDRRKADLFESAMQGVEKRVDETVRDLHASGRI